MITTRRLELRDWREADREPWAAMNADPAVRQYFPTVLDRAESDESFDRISSGLRERGWGLWAVELEGRFIGFTGLAIPSFMPDTEIGWRLSADAWGHGYATEAAVAVLQFAFRDLDLGKVVSMTAVQNIPSRRVMERIGMTYDPAADFDHPDVPEGSDVRRHVLYRIARD